MGWSIIVGRGYEPGRYFYAAQLLSRIEENLVVKLLYYGKNQGINLSFTAID